MWNSSAWRFNESSLRKQGPIRRAASVRAKCVWPVRCFTRNVGGYGSLLSQGRPVESLCETRDINASAIEQLLQNLVHRSTILRSLRGRLVFRLHRWRVRGCRRRGRRESPVLAAARGQSLLKQIAQGLAETAAEPVGRRAARSIAGGASRSASAQSAQHPAKPAAAAEQALAHLLQFCVG